MRFWDVRAPRLAVVAPLTIVLSLLLAAPAAAAIKLPPQFEAKTLANLPAGADTVAWTPDGRMLVGSAASGGSIYIFNPGATTPSVTKKLGGNIFGIAVDADFGDHPYVYVARTFGGNTTQRLTRITLRPDNSTSGETILLGSVSAHPCPPPSNTNDCITAESPHDLNEVLSDPRDGTLWVANGDESRVGGSEAVKVYNEQSYAGKILHIDRDGKGLSGHPFCRTNTNLSHVCTKVWASGLKNPFRMTLTPAGQLLVGDVGWAAYEEIDQIEKGANYGWPCYEGTPRTNGFKDNPDCLPEYAKEGTANADKAPWFEYRQAPPGAAVVVGPVYTTGGYPADYKGNLFYADYVHEYIKRLKLKSNGTPDGAPIAFADDAGAVVDLKRAPNGNLVMVTIDGKVTELRYTGSANRAPTAVARADKTSGPAPLRVRFTGSQSSDPDGDSLRYDWDFGDGTAHSTAANPVHVFAASTAVRRVVLTVRDAAGATDTETIEISPGNRPPVVTVNAPATYRDGQGIHVTGSAVDPEDGTLAASRLKWRTALVHGTHVHDPDEISGVRAVDVEMPTDHDDDSYYRFELIATDSGGASTSKIVEVDPETRQLTLNSDPAGAPVSYGDGDHTAPFTKQAAIGFLTPIAAAQSFTRNGKTYVFDSWSDGGARSHTISIPASNLSLTARYREQGGSSGGGGSSVSFEAESMTGVKSAAPVANISNPDASMKRSARFTQNATITKVLTLPAGLNTVKIRARGATCDGAPVARVTLDGATIMNAPIDSVALKDYVATFPVTKAGSHTVAIVYSNDFRRSGCDRTLEVDLVTLSGGSGGGGTTPPPPPPPPPPGALKIEAESMSGVVSTGSARAYLDASASGGRAVRFVKNTTISKTGVFNAFKSITVRAAGDQCAGAPQFIVMLDGIQVGTGSAPTTGFADHTIAVSAPAGTHTIALSYVNDGSGGGCDRNLKADAITLAP